MSSSLKCIHAFEFLRIECNLEKATEIYESMTDSEREKTDNISNLISKQKEVIDESLNSSTIDMTYPNIVLTHFPVTENVLDFFQCLGYSVGYLSHSCIPSEDSPVFLLGMPIRRR